MSLNLLDFAALDGEPREEVVLPNGRRFYLRLLDGPGYALEKETTRGDLADGERWEAYKRLLRYILEPLPNEESASDDDLMTIIDDKYRMVIGLVAASKGKLNIVMAALKNGRRLAPTSGNGGQPLSPKTPQPTPLPESPAPSGATGSSSGAGRSMKRGRRSIS